MSVELHFCVCVPARNPNATIGTVYRKHSRGSPLCENYSAERTKDGHQRETRWISLATPQSRGTRETLAALHEMDRERGRETRATCRQQSQGLTGSPRRPKALKGLRYALVGDRTKVRLERT